MRNGIIGRSGWAQYGPTPILQPMDEFENVGISSSELQPAQEAGWPMARSISFLTTGSRDYTERLVGAAQL